MKLSITTPFWTATSETAMKPTAAEIENGMPRRASVAPPPVKASGTAEKTSGASFALPKLEKSNRKLSTEEDAANENGMF